MCAMSSVAGCTHAQAFGYSANVTVGTLLLSGAWPYMLATAMQVSNYLSQGNHKME